MKYDLKLRPLHYACMSGGKDSLYMFGYVLSHPEKYPLDAVVHYELEIDWPWVKDVIDYMESECKKIGIPFYRIKPRTSWHELRKKYLIPSRIARWCNGKYKLDAEKQMVDFVRQQNCRPIAYIGFCADEEQRFKYELGDWNECDVCYPLAEEGIVEKDILEWAKGQKLFNGWYLHFKRQGCMFCPMISRKELAYMYLYYPDKYDEYAGYVKEYEEALQRPYFNRYDWKYIEKNIKTKWVSMLEDEKNQQSFTDDLYGGEHGNIF